MPIGAGLALAARLDGAAYRVYVLLGDGECQAGVVWEGAMAAAKFHLANLTAILDYNDVQLDGPVHEIMPLEPLADKWRAFNWNVIEINGHNVRQVLEALDLAAEIHSGPTVIIAHTTKGKGVSFMENRSQWHGVPPNAAQYARRRSASSRAGRSGEELMAEQYAMREAYGRALAEYGALNPQRGGPGSRYFLFDAVATSSPSVSPSASSTSASPSRAWSTSRSAWPWAARCPSPMPSPPCSPSGRMEQIRTCVCYARTNVKLVGGLRRRVGLQGRARRTTPSPISPRCARCPR